MYFGQSCNALFKQHRNSIYKQILSTKARHHQGDNNSLSLANISMHFIMLEISSIPNQAQLFKRFIDDIIWLSYGNELTEKIEQALTNTCREYELKLTFRKVSTNETGKSLEFLDVLYLYMIDNSNKFGFFTTSFIKETATKRLFLIGNSCHPLCIFKSIVSGESVRLRRLNETNDLYLKDLERLKKKCIDPYFNKKVVEKIINLAKTWTNRFGSKPLNKNKTTDSMLIWASAFSNLLQLTAKEKSLVQATVLYKRLPTLASMLTNYKKVAHSTTGNTGQGRSQPCKKCGLCGPFNRYKSMVHQTSTITAANGKIFSLKQTLDCSNYGIYVATCGLCHKQYVGQTINKFSKRWCHHRFIWNQFKYDNIDDKATLFHHYHTLHRLTLQTKPDIADCFFVTFKDQPSKHFLSIYQNIWLDKLNATININKMLLPSIK